MLLFRRFFRWRHFRRYRARSFRSYLGGGRGIGLSFGRHLARSTREGKREVGWRDRLQRRRRRVLRAVAVVLVLLFLTWFTVESLHGLRVFSAAPLPD